jgi:flagellar protein FliL
LAVPKETIVAKDRKKPAEEPEAPAPAAHKAAPEAAPEGDAPKKSKGSFVKLGIIAGLILVQVVGSYFLQKAVFFSGDVVAKEEVKAESKKKSEKKDKEKEAELNVIELEEIVVNPADTGGRRYLAITLGLGTRVAEAEKTIEKRKPLIKDALISVLSSKHLDQLSNITYRDSLKSELKDAVNKQFSEKMVESIVFSSYVLQ